MRFGIAGFVALILAMAAVIAPSAWGIPLEPKTFTFGSDAFELQSTVIWGTDEVAGPTEVSVDVRIPGIIESAARFATRADKALLQTTFTIVADSWTGPLPGSWLGGMPGGPNSPLHEHEYGMPGEVGHNYWRADLFATGKEWAAASRLFTFTYQYGLTSCLGNLPDPQACTKWQSSVDATGTFDTGWFPIDIPQGTEVGLPFMRSIKYDVLLSAGNYVPNPSMQVDVTGRIYVETTLTPNDRTAAMKEAAEDLAVSMQTVGNLISVTSALTDPKFVTAVGLGGQEARDALTKFIAGYAIKSLIDPGSSTPKTLLVYTKDFLELLNKPYVSDVRNAVNLLGLVLASTKTIATFVANDPPDMDYGVIVVPDTTRIDLSLIADPNERRIAAAINALLDVNANMASALQNYEKFQGAWLNSDFEVALKHHDAYRSQQALLPALFSAASSELAAIVEILRAEGIFAEVSDAAAQLQLMELVLSDLRANGLPADVLAIVNASPLKEHYLTSFADLIASDAAPLWTGANGISTLSAVVPALALAGQDIRLATTPVPEPRTAALLCAGMVVLAGSRLIRTIAGPHAREQANKCAPSRHRRS